MQPKGHKSDRYQVLFQGAPKNVLCTEHLARVSRLQRGHSVTKGTFPWSNWPWPFLCFATWKMFVPCALAHTMRRDAQAHSCGAHTRCAGCAYSIHVGLPHRTAWLSVYALVCRYQHAACMWDFHIAQQGSVYALACVDLPMDAGQGQSGIGQRYAMPSGRVFAPVDVYTYACACACARARACPRVHFARGTPAAH